MKANTGVARSLLQALYDEADENGTAKFDVRISDTEYLRYITVYPKDSVKHCLGTCQVKDGDKTRPNDKESAHAQDRADWACSRMEECQLNLRRIDRSMGQARGKVDGVVWAELEKAQKYWVREYEDAMSKHFRIFADLEQMLIDHDKGIKR